MRILLISNGYPPHRWAGAETYTAGVGERLQLLGHEVSVLCAGDWDAGPDCLNGFTDSVDRGVPVRRLNLNWQKAADPFGYLYNNRAVADYLAGYLEELKPDLVHVVCCETLSASVLHVVKDAGLPLVLSLVDFWFLCPRMTLLRTDSANCDGLTTPWECLECIMRPSRPYQLSRRVLPANGAEQLLTTVSRYPVLTRQRGLRGMSGDVAKRKEYLQEAIALPDCRITASKFVRRTFEANGVNAPIRVQPYGHDLSWLEGYSGKLPTDRLRIGFIGQILQIKGVHLFLEAAKALLAAVGDCFDVVIYGNLEKDPKYGAQLRDLALELPNVSFRGTYAHEDSGVVFAGLDVLAVPSIWYDFPLIIYEAFATHTPVVATDLAGMAEAVSHDVNGLLFARDDVADLTRQLQRLIEDPDLMARLRKGSPMVKTVEEEVRELEQIYRELAVEAAPSIA